MLNRYGCTRESPRAPRVNSGQFRSILGLGICARAQFRLGGPYLSHAKEMPLQSGIMQVAHQLHAVCRQAHALKGMLSQAIRLGHSAPPWNTDARASHGVACPVGGLCHTETEDIHRRHEDAKRRRLCGS
jgi:hypothetical protein